MSKTYTEEEYFKFEEEIDTNEVIECSDDGVASIEEGDPGDIVTIVRRFGASWGGVSNCGNRDRVQREFDRAFLARLQSVINEFSHLRYISSKATGGYRVRRGRRLNGSRWCNGRLVNCNLTAIFRVP